MMLSILVPTYNDACLELVTELQRQASECLGDDFEIIVGDDCSTDRRVLEVNDGINALPHCRVIRRKRNSGRSAIRNFLAHEAKGDRLILLDSDMMIRRKDFIKKYMELPKEVLVCNGSYEIMPRDPSNLPSGETCKVPQEGGLGGSLRYLYEQKARKSLTVEERRKRPYEHFNTNFMIDADLMRRTGFDERLRFYGYEDAFFALRLKEMGIEIHHIDNPVSFETFDPNPIFINKVDESIKTLRLFRKQLEPCTALLRAVSKIERLRMAWLFRLAAKTMLPSLRRNLTSDRPQIRLLNIYKLLKYFSD